MAEETRNSVGEFRNQDPTSLFPPLLDEIEGLNEFMQAHPGEGLTYEKIYEAICGTTDDSQEVEQYNGTLGVTVAFVNAHQSPVGQLQWNNNLATIYTNPGNVAGVRWCSGTLIANDLFLTAGHCFDRNANSWQLPLQNGTLNVILPADIAKNMQVNFNFQVDPSGNPRVEQSFPVTQLVEYRLGGLDFAILRLGGNPGLIYGKTQISNIDAVLNSMACIIGHPAGRRKRIEAGPVTLLQGNSIGYNDIDTLGGNSGSGILQNSDGRIVGVHTNGGCNAAMTGNNFGVRITSILAQSPTLQSLIASQGGFHNLAGNRIGVLQNGTVFVKEGGLSALWTEVSTGCQQIALAGNRIGVLQNGTVFVKEGGLSAPWTEVSTGCQQIALAGNRIGVLQNGTVFVKEGGLSALWTDVSTGCQQIALAGNRIGVLQNGTVFVKEGGLSALWTEVSTGCQQIALAGNRIGVLQNGTVFVKEGGLSALWTEVSTGCQQIALAGNRIGVLQNGTVFVKEGGLSALWTEVSTGCQQIALAGNRIGVLQNGTVFVKEGGLSAPWTDVSTGCQQIALAAESVHSFV